MIGQPSESWHGGADYESFVGRWSRLVADELVDWLDVPVGRSWLDVGCGTGALTASIVMRAAPSRVVAIDRSPDFVASARARLDDPRATFLVGDAMALPAVGAPVDVVVSGLLLNFLPDPIAAVAGLRDAVRRGGTVAAYVWDYADGMQPIRAFWDVAVELASSAREQDEAVRFPLCRPDRLRRLFGQAGLAEVATREIDVEAAYRDFDDYWSPFLSGVGPAPGYCASLPADRREELRLRLLAHVTADAAAPIAMRARAFAVRGTAP
jgi:trans-aconitate methyltransferase